MLTGMLGLGVITTASAVTRDELCAAYPTICHELPLTTKEQAPRCDELKARGLHDFEVNEPDPYGYDDYNGVGNGIGCETDGSSAPTPNESATPKESETPEETASAKPEKTTEKKAKVPTSIPAGL